MTSLLAAVTLAHPLTERGELPVSPLFLAAVALVIHSGGAWLVRRGLPAAGRAAPVPRAGRRLDAPGGTAPRLAFVVTRAVGVAVIALAIAAGRFGDDAQLSNIAPALVVGAGWPLLVLATVLAGPVWWWVDPFDTVARAAAPLGAGEGNETGSAAEPAWWAMPFAAAWIVYLTMWPGNLEPRTVANALAIYLLITVAGCMAVGRRPWLARAEVFGVFFSLIAGVRRREVAVPPRGAHVVLAVLAGGFLYGLLRDSQLLAPIGYGPRATLYSSVALVACAGATVATAHALARRESRWHGDGAVAVALVCATAALALALALARNRLTTSVQVLPILASDPFGSGLDLFGTRMGAINPEPLGSAGLIATQIGVLVVGHLLGLLAARRVVARTGPPTPARAVAPAVTMLGALLTVSVAAVAATLL